MDKLKKLGKFIGLSAVIATAPLETQGQDAHQDDSKKNISVSQSHPKLNTYKDSLDLSSSFSLDKNLKGLEYEDFSKESKEKILEYLLADKARGEFYPGSNKEELLEFKSSSRKWCDDCVSKSKGFVVFWSQKLKIVSEILKNYEKTGILPQGYFYKKLETIENELRDKTIDEILSYDVNKVENNNNWIKYPEPNQPVHYKPSPEVKKAIKQTLDNKINVKIPESKKPEVKEKTKYTLQVQGRNISFYDKVEYDKYLQNFKNKGFNFSGSDTLQTATRAGEPSGGWNQKGELWINGEKVYPME